MQILMNNNEYLSYMLQEGGCSMFEKVRDILVNELLLDENEVTLTAELKDDLGIDSLAVVDLATSIEEEFDIEISDEELENIRTVGDIVDYLNKKIG